MQGDDYHGISIVGLSEAGLTLWHFVDQLDTHRRWDDYFMEPDELSEHEAALKSLLAENTLLREQLNLALACAATSENNQKRRL